MVCPTWLDSHLEALVLSMIADITALQLQLP